MDPVTSLSLFLGAIAAFITGFSKSGLPGSGILVVPLIAAVFPGRLGVGATLPMLVVGDICAVYYHRAHGDFTHLRRLFPTVLTGLALGTLFLIWQGQRQIHGLNILIGTIVLVMLGLSLLKGKLGDKLAPTSPIGIAATGSLAGFTTMVANAAGPIMAIYMTSANLDKRKIIGTSAWYFFTFNLVKIPLLALVTYLVPKSPMFNSETIKFDLMAVPIIILGAVSGRALFEKIPQKLFNNLILVLAALASIKLLFMPS